MTRGHFTRRAAGDLSPVPYEGVREMKPLVLLAAIGAAALGLIGLTQADSAKDGPKGDGPTTRLVIGDMT